MTKAEYIERYGEAWYEEFLSRNKARNKDRYANDPEYREYQKARYKNDPEYRIAMIEYKKEQYKNNPEVRIAMIEYSKEYNSKDLNSNGKTKVNIRRQSRHILYDKRHHTKLKDYEIHHCFGYDDPSKFIYISKSLHIKIHQYLRDNNIDADSNHYDYIKHMINECEEYTYISV